jgi:hypothetical protein
LYSRRVRGEIAISAMGWATLSAPTGFTAQRDAYEPTTVIFRWNPVNGASYYYVYDSAIANSGYSYIGSTESPASVFGYGTSLTFYFKVCAVNSADVEGPMSAVATVGPWW